MLNHGYSGALIKGQLQMAGWSESRRHSLVKEAKQAIVEELMDQVQQVLDQ